MNAMMSAMTVLGMVDGPELLVTYDGHRPLAVVAPLCPITTTTRALYDRTLYDRTLVVDAIARPRPQVLPTAVLMAAALASTPTDILPRRQGGLDPHLDRRHAIEAARKAEAPAQPSAPGAGVGVSEARRRRRAAKRKRGF
ncbi:MAG: hypothetical protein IT338_17480 [Thermomicrobiales bacterium]|nr:hypothetical protein [Thermomicrobiales bacterium]